MRLAVFSCLFLFQGVFFSPLYGQKSSSLSWIITKALEFPCFADFLVIDRKGDTVLQYISSNNQIPQTTAVSAYGRELAVSSQYAKKEEPRYWVRLDKVRMRTQSAKVFFEYDKRVKARIWLQWKNGQWKVSRSFVRQKVKSKSGKKGSRFCMSF
ncbi:MAG: hypothetical protein AAF587_43315 [Bacteroidota bacterium]